MAQSRSIRGAQPEPCHDTFRLLNPDCYRLDPRGPGNCQTDMAALGCVGHPHVCCVADWQDVRFSFKGDLDDLRRLLCHVIGCSKPQQRLWVFREGSDHPIEKPKPMEVTLSKPIKPGFYQDCEVGVDEAVDKQPDGKFARSEVPAKNVLASASLKAISQS